MATIRELINNALYQSIYDRRYNKFDSEAGGDTTVALELLNKILDKHRSLIPFVSYYTFSDLAALQAQKFFEVQKLVYKIDNYRIELQQLSLKDFDSERTIDNLNSIPSSFWLNQLTHVIDVYPNPISSESSEFQVYGMPLISNNLIDDALPASITPFYQDYLELELAFRLCVFYSTEFTADRKEALVEARQFLRDNKSEDLSEKNQDIMGDLAQTQGEGTFPEFYYGSGGR